LVVSAPDGGRASRLGRTHARRLVVTAAAPKVIAPESTHVTQPEEYI